MEKAKQMLLSMEESLVRINCICIMANFELPTIYKQSQSDNRACTFVWVFLHLL